MNSNNRAKRIEERANATLPSRYRPAPRQPLSGGPLTSSKAKAEAAKRRSAHQAEQREMAESRRKAAAKRKAKSIRMAKVARRYWITPKAKRRRCSHCGSPTAAAIRPRDQKAACSGCIDRLGIKARQSSTATVEIRIRHVEPGSPFVEG